MSHLIDSGDDGYDDDPCAEDPLTPIDEKLSWLDTHVWEPLQRRYPWLQRIDNSDAKTWVLHALLTIFVGHAFGAAVALLGVLATLALGLPFWIRPHFGYVTVLGTLIAALFYIVREWATRSRLGWNYKPIDFIGDTFGPVLALLLVIWWHLIR